MPKKQKARAALNQILTSIEVLTPPSELQWTDVDDGDEPLQFASFECQIGPDRVKLTYAKSSVRIELSACAVDELHAVVDAELQALGFRPTETMSAIGDRDLEQAPALVAHRKQTQKLADAEAI